MSTVNLLVEMFQFASGITEPEFAFDPDRETENVREQQKAVEKDAAPVFMPKKGTKWNKEAQLAHKGKGQRKEDHRRNKECIG